MITVANLVEYMKLAPRTWVTATAYAKGDWVINSGSYYLCQEAHTSGTFATDLTAQKWRLVSILTTAVAHGIDFVTTGTNGRTFTSATQTEYYEGNGSDTMYFNEIVTEITSIKYWDEETDTYITIFTSPDTKDNSTEFTGEDLAIRLTNGYIWEISKKYQIVYAGGYASVPQTLKTVAIEQAMRYCKNSSEFGGYFALTSQNIGSQATSSLALETQEAMNERHEKAMNYYRIMNV